MSVLHKRLLAAGIITGSSLLSIPSAKALNGPSNIQIDGGPLGTLQLSGGMDNYFYGQTGTSDKGNPGASAVGDSPAGANLANALIGLQKTTGILQFTIEVGPVDGLPTLGMVPPKASLTIYRTGSLYLGYVTIAPPDSPVTISVGQINSLEGYEGGLDWQNANIFSSPIWYITNQNSLGVSGTYTKGPLLVSVAYGDGWDTGVFNFLQASATYTVNTNNALNIYYGGDLGRTGLNTTTYGQVPVGSNPATVNSQTFGAYYSFTRGNLNIVPELQYVYAKPDHQLLITKYTSNISAAVFGDYSFGTSPYSFGAMASYFDSIGGQTNWYIAPRAEGVGVELTPTWQYKDLFARLSIGYVHLINTGAGTGYPAYDNSGSGRNVLQSALEGGLLF